MVQCSGIIFLIRQKQRNRFPNLKANLRLCLLLDRSDSLICMCVNFKLKYFSSKLLPTWLYCHTNIRLYCIRFFVINYSLNFATFVNTILLLFVCNACLPTSTYSWYGLNGRKSLFNTNLTGVPPLTSPPPSLLFFRAPFYFAPLPTIWTPGTGCTRKSAFFVCG